MTRAVDPAAVNDVIMVGKTVPDEIFEGLALA